MKITQSIQYAVCYSTNHVGLPLCPPIATVANTVGTNLLPVAICCNVIMK